MCRTPRYSLLLGWTAMPVGQSPGSADACWEVSLCNEIVDTATSAAAAAAAVTAATRVEKRVAVVLRGSQNCCGAGSSGAERSTRVYARACVAKAAHA